MTPRAESSRRSELGETHKNGRAEKTVDIFAAPNTERVYEQTVTITPAAQSDVDRDLPLHWRLCERSMSSSWPTVDQWAAAG
jgi:hypothetical protein